MCLKVFKRYLILIKENKLRQFNFKFLYNLLPIRQNLLKWRLANDANYSHCNVEEEMSSTMSILRQHKIRHHNKIQTGKGEYDCVQIFNGTMTFTRALKCIVVLNNKST